MKKAQTIVEFSAAMVILCLLIFGLIEVFRWGVMELAEQRYDQETSGPSLSPDFHLQRPLDAAKNKN